MARVGIVFGLLLCSLTVVALLCTSAKLPSQFVPMMAGIPILFCGVVGLNPHRRKVAMRSAAAIGLLGLFVGAGLAIYCEFSDDSELDVRKYVFNLGLTLAAICLIFLACYGISHFHARSRI
ncbi:MAG: hypothetical protein WBD20_13875 [Pirellulaceae bacterium]